MITWLPFLSAIVGALAAVGVAILSIRSQREKLEAELTFQRSKFEN